MDAKTVALAGATTHLLHIGVVCTFPQTNESMQRLIHIPSRWASILGGTAEITLIYIGSVSNELADGQGFRVLPFREAKGANGLPWPIRLFRMVRYAVRKKDYDVLMNLNSHLDMWVVSLAATNSLVVARIAGLLCRQPRRRVLGFPRQLSCLFRERMSIAAVDKCLFLCKYLEDRLAERGCRWKPGRIISTGVDTTRFTFKGDAEIVDPVKELLFVGRLDPVKRPYRAVEVFRRLKRRYPHLGLNIVGRGRQENGLRQSTRGDDSIVYHGYVGHNELARLYRRSGLLLVVSDSEGLPNCVLEAMATGVPVIASSVGGIPNLLGGGTRGGLVSPSDIEGFVSTAVRFIETPQLRLGMAREAHSHIVKEHCFDVIRGGLLEFFSDCQTREP